MKRLFLASCLGLFACGEEGGGPAVPEALTPVPSADAGKGTTDYSSSNDPRLTSLPPSLKNKVLACEASNHFYDLGSQTCTVLAPAIFTCAIDDALKAIVDPSTIKPLEEYLATKALGQTLYSCTSDDKNVSLHFYKFENGVVQYRKLNIAKKFVN
ncbi:MAG: hypothetical protein H7318_02445 [Oligoflexus sp.]|nr:hypothetical protein [Oligoflexus sp.]